MSQPVMRGGIWQFRRAVPDELVSIVGKREVKQSLKTRDPRIAKLRHAEAFADSERVFALARAQLTGVSCLTPSDVQQLASRWYVAETMRLDRMAEFTDWLAEDYGTTDPQDGSDVVFYTTLKEGAEQAGEAWDAEAMASPCIVSSLRESGLPIPPKGSAEWHWLVAQFEERMHQLSRWALARQEGGRALPGEGGLPRTPLTMERPAVPVPGATSPSSGRKLSELFAAYDESKRAGGESRSTKTSLIDYKASIKTFIELFQDVDVSLVTRDLVADFRVALTKMPAKGEGMGKLSATQKIERAEREGLQPVAAGTVRNRMRHLSAVLSYGVRRGWIQENPINASGIGREVAQATSKQQQASRLRKDYQAEELAAIFSSAAFTDPSWRPAGKSDGRAWYWLPILMFYTGARIEELAQLNASEVKRSPEGHPYLSVLEGQDGDDGGRTGKTRASRRMLPLHDDVIARGFLDYVASIPAAGRLFPQLKACPNGYYSTNFAKSWGNYLRKTVGLTSSASPSHGFRHAFKTMARDVGIHDEVHDAITGHAPKGVGGTYGVMPLTRMAEELKRFPTIARTIEAGRAVRASAPSLQR